jgi:hypothetical protein
MGQFPMNVYSKNGLCLLATMDQLSYDLRVSYSFYMSYSLSTCLIGDKYTKFDYPWSCQLNNFFESCQQIAGTALAIYLDFCYWSCALSL